jgi:hypothetical protein
VWSCPTAQGSRRLGRVGELPTGPRRLGVRSSEVVRLGSCCSSGGLPAGSLGWRFRRGLAGSRGQPSEGRRVGLGGRRGGRAAPRRGPWPPPFGARGRGRVRSWSVRVGRSGSVRAARSRSARRSRGRGGGSAPRGPPGPRDSAGTVNFVTSAGGRRPSAAKRVLAERVPLVQLLLASREVRVPGGAFLAGPQPVAMAGRTAVAVGCLELVADRAPAMELAAPVRPGRVGGTFAGPSSAGRHGSQVAGLGGGREPSARPPGRMFF